MKTPARTGPVLNETYADLLQVTGSRACRRASGRQSDGKATVEQRGVRPLLHQPQLGPVDTTQDASYFGIGTHPNQRIILQYAEGDIIEDCHDNDDASYAQAFRGLPAWYLERSYWRAERSRIQSSRHHFHADLRDLLHPLPEDRCNGPAAPQTGPVRQQPRR